MALPDPFLTLTRRPLSRFCGYNNVARAVQAAYTNIDLDLASVNDADFSWAAVSGLVTCNFTGQVRAHADVTCYMVTVATTDSIVSIRLQYAGVGTVGGSTRRIHVPAVVNLSDSASICVLLSVTAGNTIAVQAYKNIGAANTIQFINGGVALTLERIG